MSSDLELEFDPPPDPPRQIVVFFDDDESSGYRRQTNVWRIFSMTSRTDCHYQPGTNIQITPRSVASSMLQPTLPPDKYISRHVLEGYKYIMRLYRPGAAIYIFGFSQAASAAQLLADIVEYIGVLSVDNGEMVPDVWDAYIRWKFHLFRETGEEKHRKSFEKACVRMRTTRDTMTQRVRVRFLGMFDAVDSVAGPRDRDFVPNSADVVRHAVSIDERRVKFRPLFYDCRDLEQAVAPSYVAELREEGARRETDAQVVWFPGDHAGVGGGWKPGEGEVWPLSQNPLIWMTKAAYEAGLELKPSEVERQGCSEIYSSGETLELEEAIQRGVIRGQIHDLLHFGNGVPKSSVLFWRLLEHLPVRRRLESRQVRWPLHRGEARQIPPGSRVHVSAVKRMEGNESYRPANLVSGEWEVEGCSQMQTMYTSSDGS
ncbi:hypothetical protein P170DRAFT_485428 [Aspergillus steynii IBT 23096]|uniref:T6SS Phospholipase effector Tle1-like catalytic domain-containing protein n=1 Tax=Aspergillus steynii IBT 23096 TaxID=1392250 RepID=A0A2I2FSY5_9EURO|nr:uncharacterized protein P170DRAFT_485428 [Aspergillus steynii IBT 23096]PLB43745.1 hypothetical protein P170DRAFT_485428 [Aspergillus steynii IBT 23096]